MKPRGPLTISGFSWARRHKRDYDAVLTLQDPDLRHGLIFHKNPRPAHHVILAADLDYPAPEPWGTTVPGLQPPQRHHVEAALAFGRTHATGSLLVHCHAGISRSTSVALAIVADRMGPGEEAAALAEVIRLEPDAVPNLMITRFADDILGRGGALVAAVTARDAITPWAVRRRVMGRQAHLRYYAIPKMAWDCNNDP